MRVFYLSDLHLTDTNGIVGKKFVHFLENTPKADDTVILGGDIFDLFVGNKSVFKEKYADVVSGIKKLEQKGCTVYFLEGNHDFHLKDVFCEQVRVIVCENDFCFYFAKKKILVSHGDLIDPDDKGYRLLRFATRTILVRALVKLIPGWFIDGVGNWSSQQSRKYHNIVEAPRRKVERLRAIYIQFAEQMVAQGYDFVLVGHSHIHDQLEVNASGRRGEYLNLGFSHEHLLVGEMEKGGAGFNVKKY